MVAETEQWLLSGDCSKCRKSKYCSKRCTANSKAYTAALKKFIERKTGLEKIKDVMRQKVNMMEDMEADI